MGMSHWKSESLNLCTLKSVCICLYLWHWIWEGVIKLNCLGAWVGRVSQCNTQAWCGHTSCASVCWRLGFAGNLFIYFNIVSSQSKCKSSLLSKEPIARKSFDSPRLKLTKLDDFQHRPLREASRKLLPRDRAKENDRHFSLCNTGEDLQRYLISWGENVILNLILNPSHDFLCRNLASIDAVFWVLRRLPAEKFIFGVRFLEPGKLPVDKL